MTTIKLKNGSGAPAASDLVQGEPALDLTNKRLYTENGSGTVIEVGTNPSTLTVDTNTLAVDATNNRVGVGTASPQRTFHVNSSGVNVVARLESTDATSALEFKDDSGTAEVGCTGNNLVLSPAGSERMRIDASGDLLLGGTTSYTSFLSSSTGNLQVNGGIIGEPGSGNLFEIATYRSTGISFSTSGDVERMRIEGSGNVGIGTSSPANNLHIHTDAGDEGILIKSTGNTSNAIISDANRSSAGAAINNLQGKWNGTAVADMLFLTGTDTTNKDDGVITFRTSSANNITERMRIDSSGNVGIGTTSPSRLLTLSGSGGTLLSLVSTNDDNCQLLFGDSGSDTVGKVVYDHSDNHMRFETNSAERMRIDSSGNVGIGTDTTAAKVHINGTGDLLRLTSTNGSSGGAQMDLMHFSPSPADGDDHGLLNFGGYYSGTSQAYGSAIRSEWTNVSARQAALKFFTRNDSTFSERMRVDTSGNVLVGTTSASGFGNSTSATGVITYQSGAMIVSKSSDTAGYFKRLGNDGAIVELRNSSATTVGILSTRAGQLGVGVTGTGLEFNDSNDAIIPFSPNANNTRDNALDLGMSSVRFDDIYATNGTIQTSDVNEKQDIEALSDAETRVAVAAKALLRKFRWKSAVRTKSHDARIHFGIIAQDLQAAFEAEGLDAGEYGMFINTTWTDEETGEERSRMGVRYSELLAFIIAAI